MTVVWCALGLWTLYVIARGLHAHRQPDDGRFYE